MAKVHGRSLGRTESWWKVQPSTSVNLLYIRGTIHHFSVHQRDLPSTSVNFPCGCSNSISFLYIRGTFRQLFLCLLYLSSTSVNFPCIWGTIRRHSVCQRDLSSTFRASEGLSFNFPWVHWTFSQPVSTFCASVEPYVNFRQLSMRPNFCVSEQLSVNFPYFSRIFLHLLSTCRAPARPSVNFC